MRWERQPGDVGVHAGEPTHPPFGGERFVVQVDAHDVRSPGRATAAWR